ncbi:MAG: glycoside hydrolase family 3 protein, partial [Chitinophagaceae bacterium]|nr:glycoside hydrolase family 3 protein [Chitinophagaceae bacterium]
MTRFFQYTLFCLGLTAMQLALAQSPSNRDIERMLRGMSVKDKVGQMTQIDLGVIARGAPCALQQPVSLDTAKCRIAFQQYRVGSVLNVGCGSGALYRQEWATILKGIHQFNQTLNPSGIPILYGIDAIHGANYTKGATLFPQPLAQAATWNQALVKQAHEVTAYEVRATGIPWNFSPVLDLGRQPLWSRFFETFGEDVYLAKTMSRSAIEGYQGNDVRNPFKVAACMKHFLGYSNPMSGRDRTPAFIDERTLREYYLPTFEEAIHAGAHTIMINSGEINGTPVHANADILTDLLRNELGFQGVAVTDWEDVYKLVDLHRVAANRKEAVYMAVMAGIDLCMTPNDFEFADLLLELVEEGRIPEVRLDLSVRRLLTLKRNLGLFEQTVFPAEMYPLFASKQHADIAYQTAAEAITLLKNENDVLPFQAKDKIVVCGNAAYSTVYLNGAWTHTWQGTDTSYVNPGKLSIAEAIQTHGKNAVFVIPNQNDFNRDSLDLTLFRQADKIVLCLGETPSTE